MKLICIYFILIGVIIHSIYSLHQKFRHNLLFSQRTKSFNPSTNLVSSRCHTTLNEKEVDIYENEILIGDLDDTADDMALETFKELSMHTDSISIQAFMEWEGLYIHKNLYTLQLALIYVLYT